MKALVCGAFGSITELRVGTQPDPVPGKGQVLIEVKAASVNFPHALIVQSPDASRATLRAGSRAHGPGARAGPGRAG